MHPLRPDLRPGFTLAGARPDRHVLGVARETQARIECADGLERRDDDLDRLVAALPLQLAAADVPRESVLNVALLGRFYERLGDHAVNVARHIHYLVSGPDEKHATV